MVKVDYEPKRKPEPRECARRATELIATPEHRTDLEELPDDDLRLQVGLYTTSEAARYLGMPASTLQGWMRPAGHRQPLVTTVARAGYDAAIPFVGFAEAFVLQAVRRAGVPVHRIRPGVEGVRAELGLQHAVASSALYTDGAELLIRYAADDDNLEASSALYTDGAELLIRYAADDDNLEVARSRQRQLTRTVADQLQLITYAGDGYASRLQLPSYGPAEVVVDPKVAFGYPVVKGAGARVKDVLDRFWAGESLGCIADDFGLDDGVAEAIVRAQTKPPR